jgi:hypothetical protein
MSLRLLETRRECGNISNINAGVKRGAKAPNFQEYDRVLSLSSLFVPLAMITVFEELAELKAASICIADKLFPNPVIMLPWWSAVVGLSRPEQDNSRSALVGAPMTVH